jgi:prevent-host-death family protein
MTRSDRNKPTSKGTKATKAEGNQTSIAGARDKLASLVHQAEDGAPVEITRRGRPVAVLLSYHEYQRLLGEGPSFWDAMMAWRNSSHVDDAQHVLGIEPDTFPRDKSPGRESPFES